MSNTNGNVYPALGINAKNQVFGVDANNKITTLSAVGFAEVIAISTNGIVWAISTTPDPKTGSYLYWSAADGNWSPVGSFTGDMFLSGGGQDTAVVYTEDGTIWYISTDGSSNAVTKVQDLQALDFGGDYLWAVFPTKPNGQAVLQFANVMEQPISWTPFSGSPEPENISVSYSGDCYGVVDFNPIFYSHDGSSTGSAGSGADGQSLAQTFKNTWYLQSTSADKNGNKIMIWEDEQGGIFVDAGFQAIQVLGTYYLAGS
jgi:hypothetical protein